MIKDELYQSFLEYLSLKDIKLVEDFSGGNIPTAVNIDDDKADKQLYTISELHKRIMGYKGYMGKRLDNKTGSVVEQYKVSIKRLKRYLKNIRMNSASSDFERALLKEGYNQIAKAENAISRIYSSGYMNILGRSMKRTEICLENIDFNNLRKKDDTIEIINLSKCCYNNVEMDCFNFLSKYKRKNIKLDYKKLVSKFCEYEGLNEDSMNFIFAMLSYPYDFMRCCDRYREKTKE